MPVDFCIIVLLQIYRITKVWLYDWNICVTDLCAACPPAVDIFLYDFGSRTDHLCDHQKGALEDSPIIL